jgi:hypothetical protein
VKVSGKQVDSSPTMLLILYLSIVEARLMASWSSSTPSQRRCTLIGCLVCSEYKAEARMFRKAKVTEIVEDLADRALEQRRRRSRSSSRSTG